MSNNKAGVALRWAANGSALAMAFAASLSGGVAQAQSSGSNDIIVTGSRVIRNGFQQPTPVTVMSTEDIQSSGVKDISEFINELPAVVGSWDLQSRSRQISSGTTGLASPALRNLGPRRTLPLLDGQRSVPSAETGEVDTATFPQNLVSRVEVVTGGASAAYGSDAVSGVINYVLDKKFTGFKGEASGGVSDYGDGENWGVNLAAGAPFAGGRGHILLSGEYTRADGVGGLPVYTGEGEVRDLSPPKRRWLYNPNVRMRNPAYTTTNGQPEFIIRPNAGYTVSVKNGALINNAQGPTIGGQTAAARATAAGLIGTAFDANGAPFQFNYGLRPLTGTGMAGGDWALTEVSGGTNLDPKQEREGIFTRLSYDLTDNLTVFLQASYNHSLTESAFCCMDHTAIAINVAANAYLPTAVRDRAMALGITGLTMGQFNPYTSLGAAADRKVTRYVTGAEGAFGAFGKEWSWDFYYQHGKSDFQQLTIGNPNRVRLAEAIDAILVNGVVVCRSLNPACKPYNPFGVQASEGAITYVGLRSNGWRNSIYTQDVAAVNLRGEPFELWAGPVSFATGAEYRREDLSTTVDPESERLEHFGSNFQATNGEFSVSEAYVETVVPLARDMSFADLFEFNGAVRGTWYSESGYVTTWKAGFAWVPFSDLRLRTTLSRDIRAPNISELFSAGVGTVFDAVDPFNPAAPTQRIPGLTVGNQDLDVERAKTWGIGGSYQPSWLPGFGMSIDYYDIQIEGSISQAGNAQTVIDNCFAGDNAACANIRRSPTTGLLTAVFNQPINNQLQVNRGIDYEASYRMNLEDMMSGVRGSLTLRYTGTNFLEAFTDSGLRTTPVFNTVGQGSTREWRHRFNLSYNYEPVTVSLTARGFSEGVNNKTWIECNTGCPTSTAANPTNEVGSNYRPGKFYYDASASYAFKAGGAESELSFSVRDIANEDPPRVPVGGNTRGNRGTDDGTYDLVGRTYRVALRFRY